MVLSHAVFHDKFADFLVLVGDNEVQLVSCVSKCGISLNYFL